MTTPPSRIVTLVVADPRGVLPAFEVASPWWMESGPIVEAARLAFGAEITIVRLLDGVEFPGGPVSYLVEAPQIDRTLLEPWPGVLVSDDRRAMYAAIGGIADLTAWADGVLDDRGLRRRGGVEQVRTWNLSCLLRLHVDDGSVLWLKAVPDFFSHEPDVIVALAGIDVTLVPEVVAARRGATLMAEVGQRDGYDVGPDRHFEAVERFHLARGRLNLADLPGVPRFTSHQMATELTAVAEQIDGELSSDERSKLAALIDQVVDRWDIAGDDPTLVHGDLHGGNLRLSSSIDRVGAGDRRHDTIIDWGDASITHPLFDLAVLDSYTPQWGSEATERWLDLLGITPSAWAAFRPLASIRLAVVYHRFCNRIEASEQIYHRNDIVPAVRTGLQFLGE